MSILKSFLVVTVALAALVVVASAEPTAKSMVLNLNRNQTAGDSVDASVECNMCHFDMETALNLLFDTVPCGKNPIGTILKDVCDIAGPFATVCKATISAVCDICKDVTKSHCSWQPVVDRECAKYC